MNFKQAQAAVTAHFNTEWDDLTDIAWPDRDLNPPQNTWVRFDMKTNLSFQASMGNPSNNRYRRQGIVTIQIFAPENKGGTDAREKADTAADIFIDNGLSGFLFRNVNAREIGNSDGWYQWNVTAEFQYDRLT